MARADLIVDLVRASVSGETGEVRRVTEALIANEERQHHGVVAERLRDALTSGRATRVVDSAHLESEAIELSAPRLDFGDLILPETVLADLQELVEEQNRRELLRNHGLEPRHRVLLFGRPGTGKTSVASALADALMLPLARLRYERIVGSLLGETAERLADAFQWVRHRPCVLLLDEFDSLAKERTDDHETGEIRRLVSNLLLLLDDLPSHVVLVAASNHEQILDSAAWRRFEVIHELPPATSATRTAWWSSFIEARRLQHVLDAEYLADAVPADTFSELEYLGNDIQRHLVLNPATDAARIAQLRVLKYQARSENLIGQSPTATLSALPGGRKGTR